MKNTSIFSSFIITNIGLLLLCHSSLSDVKFECLKKPGNVPDLPKSYHTDMKINVRNEEFSIDLKYAKSYKDKNELFAFNINDMHFKYIVRGREEATLVLKYEVNKQTTCEYIKSTDKKDFLKKEHTGENHIILKALEILTTPTEYKIYSTGPFLETGMFAVRYEGCLEEPKINISMIFAAKSWKMPYLPTPPIDVSYPETAVAEIGESSIRVFYVNFDPIEPPTSFFQPPTDVYCKGFRTAKTPPKMPNYFSYSAELVNYDRVKDNITPLISQRKVYYDYKDNISRVDFNDLLASNTDSLRKTTAQKKSIIHDYNSGFQYIINPFTGKCSIDTFKETFSAITFEETKDNRMLTGAAFFWLDDADTSYNGQFLHRGVMADVYTALRIDPKTKISYIISWFFSTESTQVAQNQNVEKNVLLSMYVRPETELAKEKYTEIHFFDFVSEEPDVFDFDLTNCFNETFSKTLVFTFPADDSLRGYEKLIGRMLNIAIKDTTGIRKQRVYTKEVIFSGKYMYAEFSLLEDSPTGPSDKKVSLEDALKKLQDSVSKGNFIVKVEGEKTPVTLKPEPNGLNIFAGDRARISGDEGYHEGSVIGLTIGMLLLGFLLGSVAINMVINRKYGVSLFQKAGAGGSRGFQNPLNECSM